MAARKSSNPWDAKKIKALRQSLGLTQTEMAEELGIRQQTVSEWETGVYKPRGASLRLLDLLARREGFGPVAKKGSPSPRPRPKRGVSPKSAKETEEEKKSEDWAPWD
ncbi:MAG: helix-turn-helix transcriptional regulator [Chloroflexi bacterium]|nr:helix-turn-helix transcriptional regulator [Chloroflexota bacterium]